MNAMSRVSTEDPSWHLHSPRRNLQTSWLAPYSSSLLPHLPPYLSLWVPRTCRGHHAPHSYLFQALLPGLPLLDHPSPLPPLADSSIKIQLSPPPEAFPSQVRCWSFQIWEHPLLTSGAALVRFHCNGLFMCLGLPPDWRRIPWVFVSSELAQSWARTFPVHYLISSLSSAFLSSAFLLLLWLLLL